MESVSWLPRFVRRDRPASPGRSGPRVLELYTRDGCHLCDEMKQAVRAAGLGDRVTLREIDIAGDPALEHAYGRSIPVLAIDGRVAFKGRLTPAELKRKLDRYAREATRPAVEEQRGGAR